VEVGEVDTFELKVAQQDGRLAVLEVAGYINNEAGEAIAAEARRLLENGHRSLLLDLAATRIINSIGISLLLEVLEQVLEVRGTLAFCSLSPSIAKTFQIMGLAQYTQIHPDRALALTSLAATP
jgi:anti-anti-sigma factor